MKDFLTMLGVPVALVLFLFVVKVLDVCIRIVWGKLNGKI
jgi:hypothetical protein